MNKTSKRDFMMRRQLLAGFFRRVIDDEDEVFYLARRLVVHLDDDRFAKLGGIIEPTIGPRFFPLQVLIATRQQAPARAGEIA